MARKVEKLSAPRVQKLVKPGMHGDGAGLWLQVASSGSKSWIFRYTLFGRAREMGLGAARDVSLSEARQLAADFRRQVRTGQDPIEVRNASRQARRLEASMSMTFEACATYLGSVSSALRFRIYDKAKHLTETKGVISPFALRTRFEAVLRQCGPTTGLPAIANPFSKLRVASVDTARALSADKAWHQFLDRCCLFGAPTALSECSKHFRQKWVNMLSVAQTAWWRPENAWPRYPNAIAAIYP